MSESFRSPSKVIKRFRYLPVIVRRVKNWAEFMRNYAWGIKPEVPYILRNGAQMKIGRAIDHVPIIEVFLLEDYGKIPDNATIIDLGANIGVFSIYAATQASNVKIYAYEPLKDFYELMLENVKANRKEENIKCFNLAVASDSLPRTLYVKGTAFFFPTFIAAQDDASQVAIQVPCITLSEIFETNDLKKVDLLKMDCEGAEYEILYNAPNACFQLINEIRMEYHNLDGNGRNVEGLKKFLAERAFAITHIKANSATNGSLWAVKRA